MKSRVPRANDNSMNEMVKRFQRAQQQIQQKSEEIEQMKFTCSSGGGAVTVVISGEKMLESISINPEVVDSDDVEMLQDLIMSAVNEGLRQVDDLMEIEMGRITNGIPMPGIR